MLSAAITVFLVISITCGTAENLVPLHRYVHTSGIRHFYTVRGDEIGTITHGAIGRHGYQYQGVACAVFNPTNTPPSNTISVYRYEHLESKQHFYTTSWKEVGTYVDGVVIGSWRSASKQAGTVPLYRYSHQTRLDHFYTTSACEIGTVIPGLIGIGGYKSEGVLGYVLPAGSFSPPASVC